jgi:hypothetical protein
LVKAAGSAVRRFAVVMIGDMFLDMTKYTFELWTSAFFHDL